MKKFNFHNLFIMLFLLIALPISVLARDEITLEADKTDLEIGDIVSIKASLPNDSKLYALSATLSYDHNVFTSLNESSFISDAKTVSILYNSLNNKFGI